MASPRSRLELFDQAIANGKLSSAWFHAVELPHLSLDRALRLTMLMGVEESRGFEKAGRRFLIRFIRECEPSLEQVKRVADALNEVSEDNFDRPHALRCLDDLAEQFRGQA